MCIIRPFTWYGGKLRFIQWLQFLIPSHTIWCEPFMGSAAFTLNHSRSEREIINDFDSDLVCLMRTLKNQQNYREFIKSLLTLEYSEKVFQTAKDYKKNKYYGLTDVERALWEYVLISQSFNSSRKSFSRGNTTFNYHMDILHNLPKVHDRLQNVEIRQGDAITLIENLKDYENTFMYLDPPYLAETRAKGARNVYGKEMSDPEQIRLLNTIQQAKCKIMLSGYKSELYDRYLLPYGFKRYKLCDIVKSCQYVKNGKKDIAEEFIWVNYQLPDTAKYLISLKEYDFCQEKILDISLHKRSNSTHKKIV